VTNIATLTGYPRDSCLRFVRKLGVNARQYYRDWTQTEQQRLLDLVAMYPPAEVAKMMGRPVGSIRGMLARLDASAQMGRDWFTVHTLSELLHISANEVQRWIKNGWLTSRLVETGSLQKHIIHADDFADFVKRYRDKVVGRRLRAHHLEVFATYLFPPSHAELLPVRERGYKRRTSAAVLTDDIVALAASGNSEPRLDGVAGGEASGYDSGDCEIADAS